MSTRKSRKWRRSLRIHRTRLRRILDSRRKLRAQGKEHTGRYRYLGQAMAESKAVIRKLKRLIAREEATPRIIVARDLVWGSPYGPLGKITKATVHHSAGPTDRNDDHALELARSYAKLHDREYGSRGLGYHLIFTRSGSIICARRLDSKGAHVAGRNTGNVGCLFNGTTGDYPTDAQRRAWEWWLDNGHTTAMPAGYRTPVAPRRLDVRGHREWPGQSTACPGTHIGLVPGR